MKKLFTLLLFVPVFCTTTIVKAQVNKIDSLALVDLYNSTNGSNWINHSGWLTGPVKYWHGITLGGDRVTVIILYANNLSGVIPSSIGNFSNLTLLELGDNQLSGSIPPELGNLSNLSLLSLTINQLNGSIPPEIGNLASLQELYLSFNQLTGTLPAQIGNLSNLTYLDLGKNELSGSIPPEIGNLSNLGVLGLSFNQFSGSIPPEIGNLNVGNLYLSNNQLSGTIPPEIGNLSHLHQLNLENNQLSGSIPPELGNLFNISWLILFNNQLSGSIPPALGKIYSLSGLDLSNNNLSGEIPSFGGRRSLSLLNLSRNKFTFEGMEKVVIKNPVTIYAPQARITINTNSNTLSVSAGGTLSNNTYLWVKKGQKDTIKIMGDSTFHPTESGTYAVRVKNKVATELKLTSNIIHYTAPVTVDELSLNKTAFSNEGFSVYPNPAKDVLHVTTNCSASFSLMNASGKILFTKSIDKTGTINVSTLAAGEYYLKNNTINVVKKVVVIR